MKIRTRLALGFALIVIASFYLLLRQFSARVETQYMQAVEEPMVETSQLLAALLETQIRDGGIDATLFREGLSEVARRPVEARIYSLLKTSLDLRVYITDAAGIVLFDTAQPGETGADFSEKNDVLLTLQGRYGARSTRTDESDETSSIMYVGAPVRSSGKIVGVVSVGKPQRSMAAFIAETRDTIARFGWITAGCAILAGVLFSTWLTRPVTRLTHYARAIAQGQRVALPSLGRSELGTLGHAFEEMRDELEGRQYVERYVQTLTHELKSPIAAARGAAELLEEDMPAEQRARFLRNIRIETDRMQNIVDRLLHLAALEGRKQLEDTKPVEAAEILRTVAREAEPVALRRNITLHVSAADGLRVTGDAFLLETAVGNLLQNALEFSPDGSEIEITLDRADDRVRIVVADRGPGVPEYARERIFERFYSLPRPGTERKSSGLGLCLAREIATLHGGHVALHPREGGGTEAALDLPLKKFPQG